MEADVLLNRGYLPATLQDVLSQMTVIFIVISVETSNLTYPTLFYAHKPDFNLIRFLVTILVSLHTFTEFIRRKFKGKLLQSEYLSLSLVSNTNHQISLILVVGIHTKISWANLILAYTDTVLSHVLFEAPVELFFFNWRIEQGFVTRHKWYISIICWFIAKLWIFNY